MVWATAPLIACAIDHPVDHDILNIPIPVPDFRYFISGGLCAATSHGITTPIDVVKTRVQAEPKVFQDGGLLESAQIIIEKDGLEALLGGLGPTVIGYGIEGAAKFGLYESLKQPFLSLLSSSSPTIPYFFASVLAGAAASLLLCPLERARIRTVTDPTFEEKNLLVGLSRITQEEGPSGLFRGCSAMICKQVPYTIFKQVSFDLVAKMLYGIVASATLFAPADVKLEVSVGAAFCASILACIASHPGDVLLTATFQDASSPKLLPSVLSNVYEQRGINGFFTGIGARFYHVGAIITSQLVLYDFIKQLLGLPATGS
eukprot:CAMPEP_0178901332 /NCGR_PEP_ID=MMETSP0786-20121207/3962_1 /TAXON_ID=186022 /ORGANISM="Thalassionema frauenfeldii, Strain CCMP 1798" /LENGTH=316 /DNA_ID=CAMNT_0020572419 /DNA_START=276 /DNA_END=1226 /DNA_ORIENTATION=-